eukprot:5712425-Prymnesium_polylepis.2
MHSERTEEVLGGVWREARCNPCERRQPMPRAGADHHTVASAQVTCGSARDRGHGGTWRLPT